MLHKSWTWRVLWIYFNITMFVAYTVFGCTSLFWPALLEELWLYPLHLAGILLNVFILYGLVKKRLWTVFLVAAYSFAMILHLLVFIFVPISMSLAYIGPSRSFYTLVILLVSSMGIEEHAMTSILIFNVLMLAVHAFNIWFFISKSTVKIFQPAPPETS